MSEVDIRAGLKSLPVDMTATYRRILDRIYAQPPVVVEIAKRAFTWVITAARPLTPLELALVIAIEPTSKIMDGSEEVREVLPKYKPHVAIAACCGLLAIEGDVVRPIHFTMQEFLKGDQRGIGSEVEANAQLAGSSIHYILCDFRPRFIRYLPVELPSSSYVFHYWNHHVRRLPLPLPKEVDILVRYLASNEERI